MRQAVMWGALAASLASTAGSAHALEELRLGVMAHNIQVIDGKNAGKEDGPNIEAELVFGTPDFLSWAGNPNPYVMASVNVAGETSFAAVGLNWDIKLADGWEIEPGFGYGVHNGEIDNPFPNGSPEAQTFQDEHVLMGSRDVFRTSLSLTRDLTDSLAVQLTYEHLSHGQILGNGRNQGLDEAGVRLAWKFGE
jgi:lipid A 3-O-deacylase